MATRQVMNVLRLRAFPIFQQLLLEEQLLRTTSENWCIINDGTHPPSIVMGLSGKPQALLQLEKVVQDQVPVIKRFSGGGTVVVDEDTIFVTLICSRGVIQDLPLFPRPIMHWTEKFYNPVFKDNPGFQLREHDYVFGEQKFGGNAQSITKNRWLHHTSFLWDYKRTMMSYLKFPERTPSYRVGRMHEEFICRLKDHYSSRISFLDSIEKALRLLFLVEEMTMDNPTLREKSDHIHTTTLFTNVKLKECMESVLEK